MAHVDCRNASAEPAADSALGECAIGSARRASIWEGDNAQQERQGTDDRDIDPEVSPELMLRLEEVVATAWDNSFYRRH